MSWLYPRTVTVTRSAAPAAFGEQTYQGRQAAKETNVTGAVAVPASIQANQSSSRPLGDLPGTSQGRGDWAIFLPTVPLSVGILKDDIVTDDKGVRYNVTLPYWNGFGYKLTCETLKT